MAKKRDIKYTGPTESAGQKAARLFRKYSTPMSAANSDEAHDITGKGATSEQIEYDAGNDWTDGPAESW